MKSSINDNFIHNPLWELNFYFLIQKIYRHHVFYSHSPFYFNKINIINHLHSKFQFFNSTNKDIFNEVEIR